MGTAWGPPSGPYAPGKGTSYWQFQSAHTGFVNFAFADGSVRGISWSVDYNTYVYASGMQDGQVVDANALGN
jgi:prepilin-type processing-associated H-X9-DG protein